MKDPRRLLDGDGTEEQRALLRAGASEEPPPDGGARVLASLGISAPAGSSGTGGVTSSGGEAATGGLASASAGATSVIKLALALGTAALLGTGALLWSERDDERAASRPAANAGASAEPSAKLAPGAPQVAGAQPSGSVALEIEALERARALLAHKDGTAALAALRDYARHHPAGVLQQEADVLRVEALLIAGDRAAASDLAARLLQQRGDTPHRARLQWLLQQASAQPEP